MSDTSRLIGCPPVLLAERLVEEAQALTGGQAGLYVVDLDGRSLRSVCGSPELAGAIPLCNAVGPEIAASALDDLRARIRAAHPGGVVAPLWVRGRATSVLVSSQGPADELERLAEAAAPAVELAVGYTDAFERARRHRRPTTAAEIQQELLAPRIAPVSGGVVVASLIPAYDVGGDWFDHAENREGTWLGVADVVGHGMQAVGLSALTIGAFRAARRAGDSLEECCQVIEDAIHDPSDRAYVTAVLALWHATTLTLTWVNCGHPPPLLLKRDGVVIELDGDGTHPLGLWREDRGGWRPKTRKLEPGDRVLIYSDGVTERRTSDGDLLGLETLIELLGGLPEASAAETVITLEQSIHAASETDLIDDATQLVLEVQPHAEPRA